MSRSGESGREQVRAWLVAKRRLCALPAEWLTAAGKAPSVRWQVATSAQLESLVRSCSCLAMPARTFHGGGTGVDGPSGIPALNRAFLSGQQNDRAAR